MVSGETANLTVFQLTRLGIEPMIYHTGGGAHLPLRHRGESVRKEFLLNELFTYFVYNNFLKATKTYYR